MQQLKFRKKSCDSCFYGIVWAAFDPIDLTAGSTITPHLSSTSDPNVSCKTYDGTFFYLSLAQSSEVSTEKWKIKVSCVKWIRFLILQRIVFPLRRIRALLSKYTSSGPFKVFKHVLSLNPTLFENEVIS